jgi:two-component system, chemotaxis family, CheB/CheR fusion protein
MVSTVCDNWHPEEDRFKILENLQVLVVDDNEDSIELVRMILEEYGTQVVTAASAREAFNMMTPSAGYANAPFKPDVLISDIAMPFEDGYWLIHQLRSLSPHQGGLIPAIALTACATQEERIHSLEAGFQVHLLKPIEPDEIVAVVADLAEQTLGMTVFN